MSAVFDFIHKIHKIFHCSRGSKFELTQPQNLVRLCKKRDAFVNIINGALNSPDEKWEQSLISSVIDYVLGGESSGVSVYRTDTLDPLDHGHALAVMAEGISQKDFRSSRGAKRKPGCTRGSLLIPTACLPKTTSYEFTPKNNLDFYPANNFHFDLTISDPEELAVALLSGIKKRNIAWSFLGNEKPFEGSYRLQAAIAYSYCLQTFGKLTPDAPPASWTNGENLPATEQIDTLKHLAQTKMSDSQR